MQHRDGGAEVAQVLAEDDRGRGLGDRRDPDLVAFQGNSTCSRPPWRSAHCTSAETDRFAASASTIDLRALTRDVDPLLAEPLDRRRGELATGTASSFGS